MEVEKPAKKSKTEESSGDSNASYNVCQVFIFCSDDDSSSAESSEEEEVGLLGKRKKAVVATTPAKKPRQEEAENGVGEGECCD